MTYLYGSDEWIKAYMEEGHAEVYYYQGIAAMTSDPKKAIELFKKAWDHARKATEYALKP